MLPLLLIAGGLLITGGIIAAFWDDICKWIEKAAQAVKKIVSGIVHGVKVYIKKVASDIYQELSKFYSFNENKDQWEETIVSKKVSSNDVPDDIKKLATSGREQDISDQFKEKLVLAN